MNNYIIVGDLHIKYIAPVFRKETYFEELKNKIRQINIIAQENNAQVICLGDFFNSYIEDYFESIMYELSDLIRGWTSLIGNHDCKNTNGDLKGTSFGILEKMHYINIEAPKNMDFFHYYNREEFNGKSNNKIALIHDYIMPKGTKENFEYISNFLDYADAELMQFIWLLYYIQYESEEDFSLDYHSIDAWPMPQKAEEKFPGGVGAAVCLLSAENLKKWVRERNLGEDIIEGYYTRYRYFLELNGGNPGVLGLCRLRGFLYGYSKPFFFVCMLS